MDHGNRIKSTEPQITDPIFRALVNEKRRRGQGTGRAMVAAHREAAGYAAGRWNETA